MRGDDEWIRKQRESQKKRWQDPEYRATMSTKRKGKKLVDIVGEDKAREWQSKRSKTITGKKRNLSPETKKIFQGLPKRQELRDGLAKFNKSEAKRKAASVRMRRT